MFKFLVVVSLSLPERSLGGMPTDGTKLISTILVHRHGDRTPIESGLELSTNRAAVAAATAPFGYGQLTEVGKRRAYHLGQTIRERYNDLLSPRYNKSEIYIRSIDSTRAKMTSLAVMAAVYPPYPGSWSDDIKWVPTPYTTVPAKYDFNMFNLNCPTFLTGFQSRLFLNPPRMKQHFDAMNVVSNYMGTNITSLPIMAYNYYDGFVSQLSLGVPLTKEIANIMPKLEKAAGEALDFLIGNEEYLAYEAGVMLNEFFNQADDMIYGDDAPRVRIYSAHDLNVYAFRAASRALPRLGFPKYASYFALELRQYTETGDYGVLPVYQPEPGSEVVYLTVSGCDALPCPLETFRQLVSTYTIDEDAWTNKCGFNNAQVMDDTVFM